MNIGFRKNQEVAEEKSVDLALEKPLRQENAYIETDMNSELVSTLKGESIKKTKNNLLIDLFSILFGVTIYSVWGVSTQYHLGLPSVIVDNFVAAVNISILTMLLIREKQRLSGFGFLTRSLLFLLLCISMEKILTPLVVYISEYFSGKTKDVTFFQFFKACWGYSADPLFVVAMFFFQAYKIVTYYIIAFLISLVIGKFVKSKKR